MRRLLSAPLLFSLSVAACAESSTGAIPASAWHIASIGDVAPFADGQATVSFDGYGRLSAYAGCNRMGGSYTLSGDRLTVSPMFSTMMACEGKMEAERRVSEMLSGQLRYIMRGNNLMLTTAQGERVVLEKAHAD